MRTLIKFTFFVATVALSFTACTKDNSTAPQSTIITGNITPSLTDGGTWRIDFFSNNGVDQTSTYQGFNLLFSKTGNVTATSSYTTFSGAWATSNNDRLTLTLDFVNKGAFEEITHEWTVLQQSTTQIKLSNISNGKNEVDYLTLNKNLIK